MNFETWYQQLQQECSTLGIQPPLRQFAKAFFSTGKTPVEVAEFIKQRVS